MCPETFSSLTLHQNIDLTLPYLSVQPRPPSWVSFIYVFTYYVTGPGLETRESKTDSGPQSCPMEFSVEWVPPRHLKFNMFQTETITPTPTLLLECTYTASGPVSVPTVRKARPLGVSLESLPLIHSKHCGVHLLNTT